MKKFILSLAAMLLCVGVQAQKPHSSVYFEYSPYKVTTQYDNVKMTDNDELYHGFTIGYNYRLFLFGEHLYAEAGLGLGLIHHGTDNKYTRTSLNITDLRLPLVLGYEFDIPVVKIAPYAGVNFRLLATGNTKLKNKESGDVLKYNLFDDEYRYNRFQCGLLVGARFNILEKVYLSAAYAPDFSFISGEKGRGAKLSGFNINLGYFF